MSMNLRISLPNILIRSCVSEIVRKMLFEINGEYSNARDVSNVLIQTKLFLPNVITNP